MLLHGHAQLPASSAAGTRVRPPPTRMPARAGPPGTLTRNVPQPAPIPRTMIRGPLHNRGADSSCTECGEPFPCPTGIAIFESVVGLETPDALLRAANRSEI